MLETIFTTRYQPNKKKKVFSTLATTLARDWTILFELDSSSHL